ncbi:MAG: dTDP-4-dehydrorhamnose 3,5-epimerase family protein [Candidatus Accumulibacter phosphatis]|jgi:dTDP-4-dehydrorhamnose 3,5-epimerase|uniref:dTDP-4-dehydrorhamnose 3,5-epimerase family protein n=1 Tax=Candidatus Accumulibacter sp. ACC012 TaxID=2823332 RepID=UPI0025B98260|nr:dTDP-4-dehydrorhamnose 3,5-epimerase family protein [Candidatus Accumulibacter sp. ACC012]
MEATSTTIPDVIVLEAKVFGDGRGFFFESLSLAAFTRATGCNVDREQEHT